MLLAGPPPPSPLPPRRPRWLALVPAVAAGAAVAASDAHAEPLEPAVRRLPTRDYWLNLWKSGTCRRALARVPFR
jgi:hypothetical protein